LQQDNQLASEEIMSQQPKPAKIDLVSTIDREFEGEEPVSKVIEHTFQAFPNEE
jgi:hypothetical protein